MFIFSSGSLGGAIHIHTHSGNVFFGIGMAAGEWPEIGGW